MGKGFTVNYTIFLVVIGFFVLFTTGLAIASQHVDGIDDMTGIEPPSEIEACQVLSDEEDIETGYFLQIGGGYNSEEVMDNYVSRNWLSTSDSMRIEEGEESAWFEGDVIYSDYKRYLENITVEYSILGNDSSVEVSVSNMSAGIAGNFRTGETIAEETFNESTDGDIETVKLDVEPQLVAGTAVRIDLDRGDENQEPILWRVTWDGYESDEEITDLIRGMFRGIGNLVTTAVAGAKCVFAQVGNLFKIVVFNTDNSVINGLILPFQIVFSLMLILLALRVLEAVR